MDFPANPARSSSISTQPISLWNRPAILERSGATGSFPDEVRDSYPTVITVRTEQTGRGPGRNGNEAHFRMAITVGNRWPVEASDETSGGLRSAHWGSESLRPSRQTGAGCACLTWVKRPSRLEDSRGSQAGCATGGVIPSTMRTSPLRKPPDPYPFPQTTQAGHPQGQSHCTHKNHITA